ncbi:MAG: hypothetical protein HW390_1380 [Candidatus Brocadiaceae bacterium]|nr:hypothetical protein [Candidatus Brocadiaceae bacterium]
MNHAMNDQERLRLNQRVAEVERNVDVQVVLAVVDRCDVYAELPWKAFALGASVAGLLIALSNMLGSGCVYCASSFIAVSATLAVGAMCALVCVIAPAFARLFLDAVRAEVESRQYAESLFLSRELFAVRRRTGILVLVSLFERRVIVLPDTGLSERLSQDAIQEVIARITKPLASGQIANAFGEGLNRLESLLAVTATGRPVENELPDGIIEGERP